MKSSTKEILILTFHELAANICLLNGLFYADAIKHGDKKELKSILYLIVNSFITAGTLMIYINYFEDWSFMINY